MEEAFPSAEMLFVARSLRFFLCEAKAACLDKTLPLWCRPPAHLDTFLQHAALRRSARAHARDAAQSEGSKAPGNRWQRSFSFLLCCARLFSRPLPLLCPPALSRCSPSLSVSPRCCLLVLQTNPSCGSVATFRSFPLLIPLSPPTPPPPPVTLVPVLRTK